MTSKNRKQISAFNKAILIVNIFLFGITSFLYYMDDMLILAYVLGGAGLVNIIWSLFKIPVRNIFFVILNFVFTGLSIYLAIDLQLADSPYFAMLWFALALVYLVIAFVVLLKVKTKKTAVEKEDVENSKTDSLLIEEDEEEDVSLNNSDK
jgi:phosphate/sulfate permease